MGTFHVAPTTIDDRPTRRLRQVLWAGAIVDLVLALIIFFPPRAILDLTRISVGEPPMYFRYAGLLLVVLPIFYVMGARSPEIAPAMTRGAIAARTAGVVFLLFHVIFESAPVAFVGFAALDGTFAVLHARALSAWGRAVRG
jgi:hypothetical protein